MKTVVIVFVDSHSDMLSPFDRPLYPIFLYTDQVFYALNEDKVCRGVALMLLQNAVKFNLREFQEVWQQSIPEGMSSRLDQLKVCALKKQWCYIRHPARGLVCLQIS